MTFNKGIIVNCPIRKNRGGGGGETIGIHLQVQNQTAGYWMWDGSWTTEAL